MKIACFVNNYQYGENRFSKMRDQYGYDDVLLDKYHHIVWLDVPEDSVNWIKKLLGNDYHHNVVYAHEGSKDNIIQVFKNKLEFFKKKYQKDSEEKDFEKLFKEQNIKFTKKENEYSFENYKDLLKALQILIDRRIGYSVGYSENKKQLKIYNSNWKNKEEKITDSMNKDELFDKVLELLKGPESGYIDFLQNIVDTDDYLSIDELKEIAKTDPYKIARWLINEEIIDERHFSDSVEDFEKLKKEIEALNYPQADLRAHFEKIERLYKNKKITEEQYEELMNSLEEAEIWFKDLYTDASVKISDIIKKESEGYIIYSHKGKRLSKAFKTKKEAEERLKEIEMFKHMNKDSINNYIIKKEKDHYLIYERNKFVSSADTYSEAKKEIEELTKENSKEILHHYDVYYTDYASDMTFVENDVLAKSPEEAKKKVKIMYGKAIFGYPHDAICTDSKKEIKDNMKLPHLDALIEKLNAPMEFEFDGKKETEPSLYRFTYRVEGNSLKIYDENEEYTSNYEEDLYFMRLDIAQEFGFPKPKREDCIDKIHPKIEKALKEDGFGNEVLEWENNVIMSIHIPEKLKIDSIKVNNEEVLNWLNKFLVKKHDPKNKLGKTYIRSLTNEERLPNGVYHKATTGTSGILHYKGKDYYWYLDKNDKLIIEDTFIKDSNKRFICKSYFDNKQRGLEDQYETNDIEEAKEWIWSKSQSGLVTRIIDLKTGELWENENLELEDLERIQPYEEPEEIDIWEVSWYNDKGVKFKGEFDSEEDAKEFIEEHKKDPKHYDMKIKQTTLKLNDASKIKDEKNIEQIKNLIDEAYNYNNWEIWVDKILVKHGLPANPNETETIFDKMSEEQIKDAYKEIREEIKKIIDRDPNEFMRDEKRRKISEDFEIKFKTIADKK